MSNQPIFSVLSGSKAAQAKLASARSMLSGVKNGYPTAVMRALNRASRSGRTKAVKTIRGEYTVKAAPLRRSFAITKATTKNLETELSAKGSRLPLTAYRFTPKQDTTGNARKPVRVAIQKKGLRPVGASFVFKGKILQRLTPRSNPLAEPLGPAVPFLANQDAVIEGVEGDMSDVFLRRLDHETKDILERGVRARNGGKIHG